MVPLQFVIKSKLLPLVFIVLLYNFKYCSLQILGAYLVHNCMQPELQHETIFSPFLAVSSITDCDSSRCMHVSSLHYRMIVLV